MYFFISSVPLVDYISTDACPPFFFIPPSLPSPPTSRYLQKACILKFLYSLCYLTSRLEVLFHPL